MITKEDAISQVVEVAPVWAGHPVGFALLTHGEHQFIAFYDDQRQMTVGERRLDESAFQLVRLPETVGWDSHNYITLAVDDDNYLHLSGNMHGHPLVYFRTTEPLMVGSFQRVVSMVGSNEERTTYPAFFRGPSNELVFTYRDGSSGNGNQIYNVYDHPARVWKRLLDTALTDGEGERNAYLAGPQRGPDGYFHLIWVWRDTPDAATNHSLTYARSKDLVSWERSDGTPLVLPITLISGEIVDPTTPGGGIMNGNVHIGFDTQNRVILTYHKYDSEGNTQVYNARREADGWKYYQTSDWNYRWNFEGYGTIIPEVRLSSIRAEPDGKLSLSYRHIQHGNGTWVLDEATLQPLDTLPVRPVLPSQLSTPELDFPGMEVRSATDLGTFPEPGTRYVLRWETLGQNRDRPRPEPWPEPSQLRLYKLRADT